MYFLKIGQLLLVHSLSGNLVHPHDLVTGIRDFRMGDHGHEDQRNEVTFILHDSFD